MNCSLCNAPNVDHIVNYSGTDRRFVCFDCADAWTAHKYCWDEPYSKNKTNIDGVEYTEIYNVGTWGEGEGPDMNFTKNEEARKQGAK